MWDEKNGQYQLADGDWEIFAEKLECYLLSKNITNDEVKVAILVTRLGKDAHALLRKLVAPAKITHKKYDELIEIMTNELRCMPSEVRERYDFHALRQEPEETIGQFVTKLKNYASYCNFENLNNALRDQFVWGVKDEEIRVALFETTELTFEKAVEVAVVQETIGREMDMSLSTQNQDIMEDRGMPEVTFRYTVRNFSKLDCERLSPTFYVRNLPWNILVKPCTNHIRDHESRKSLGFFLECNRENDSSTWSCYASIEFRLLPHKKNQKALTGRTEHLFCRMDYDWGYRDFIYWEDLLDKEQGYIKNDSIVLEVHVMAGEPHDVMD
ncbi:uncharacterized protein LOC107217876 [Neodiprion lecontei]|uniref:Uncharacterized protein LOC107217876 n=1 Tax=Neodiprion lecontei TaxID=441921 RepID=A0A6J0BBG5_NEOLC|nr:uncharacterized protein LOC107217876 [Neodiprion lecontei]